MYIKLIQPKMKVRPMDSEMKIRMAPPLGLYTIANIVKEKHKVIIVNESIEDINFNDTPDLVGITVAVDSLPRAIEIAETYRAKGVKVIAGGIHITSASHYLPENAFDSFCIGPAEGYFNELLEDLKNNELKHYYSCPANFTSNALYSPAYEMIDKRKYLYSNVICTSRGCPFRCDFCYNSSENRRHLQRPVEDVLSDVKAVESINQESIEGVHKVQNSVGDYQKLIDMVHSLGMMINASFVFGLDNDTSDTFRTTADWIIKNKIETVTSHILTPYPGTKQYEKLLAEGRITTNDLSKYNTSYVVFKPRQMSDKELREGYLWLYEEVYSWKNIFKRLPRVRKQILPFLAFNIFYRKYGKFTNSLCKIVTYKRIGYLGEYISRYLSK